MRDIGHTQTPPFLAIVAVHDCCGTRCVVTSTQMENQNRSGNHTVPQNGTKTDGKRKIRNRHNTSFCPYIYSVRYTKQVWL